MGDVTEPDLNKGAQSLNVQDLGSAQSYLNRAAVHLRVMCLGALAVAWALLTGNEGTAISGATKYLFVSASASAIISLALDLLESYFGSRYFMQLAGVLTGANRESPWRICQMLKQISGVVALGLFVVAASVALVPTLKGQDSGLTQFLKHWSGRGDSRKDAGVHFCMHLDLDERYDRVYATLDDRIPCTLSSLPTKGEINLQCGEIALTGRIANGLLTGTWRNSTNSGPFSLYPRTERGTPACPIGN